MPNYKAVWTRQSMGMLYKGLLIVLLMLKFEATGIAGEFYIDSPLNKGTLRFEIDNDMVWKEDSNFTNGWSLQYHTERYISWEESRAPASVKWIGQHLPGLDDDDSIVRNGHGIGQNMFTPGDLSAEFPQENDLPYAGTLTYTLSWQSFNRDSARIFQSTVGILGRQSFAREFQKFVHNDLGRGDDPKGWGTQRKTEPILNFGYQYMLRVAHFGGYTNTWGGQVTLVPSVSLGNFITGAGLGLGIRCGWNILEGFSTAPAPPGYGAFHAAALPKPASASPHCVELILGVRGEAVLYSVLYDGSVITDDERDVDRRIAGVSAVWGLNYHYLKYLSVRAHFVASTEFLEADALPQPPPGRETTQADNSYGTLIIDFHF